MRKGHAAYGRGRELKFTMRNLKHLPLLVLIVSVGASAAEPAPDLLGVVQRFADAMIDKSRSRLPKKELPLFPIVLTRDTYEIPKGNVQNLVTARVPQEFKHTANPHHDQNIYQIFYALTAVTGQKKYAAEADRVLSYFLKNCQDPRYGFYTWGEHLGWDLNRNEMGGYPRADAANGAIHEFYRPWIFWEKSFELAPENALRFAQALWKHQIDHKGGSISFSRHAMVSKGDTPNRRGYEFPRHGGFYIATWATAYRKTNDAEMLKAIEALVGFYESRRDPKTGVIPHYTGHEFLKSGEGVQNVYTPSNASFAVDLHDAAQSMPAALKTRMLDLARSQDRAILAMPHEPGPGGKGFVMFSRPESLEPTEYWSKAVDITNGLPPRRMPYSGGWRSAYIGQYSHSWIMPSLMARYEQNKDPNLKRLILACADNYLVSEPDFKPDERGRPPDVEAGVIGNVMLVLNNAYILTREVKYLARAEWFGNWAVKNFWPDAHPLPCASVRENVYSAPSRSDTLVMALLQTSLLRHQPEKAKTVKLLASDRS